MIKKSLISIIVPVYNAELYLPNCIDSLINQTYNNLEIILVNNMSTDKSLELCKKYAKADERVIILNIAEKGVSYARNAGIEIARGEYVGFVDADDWVDEDYVEILADNIERYKVEISVVNYGNQPEKGIKCVFTVERGIKETLKRRGIKGVVWNKMFRRSLLIQNSIRFEEMLQCCEDTIFAVNAFGHATGIAYNDKRVYHYNCHQDSATNRGLTKEKLSALMACEMLESTIEKYPNLSAVGIEWECEIMRWLLKDFWTDKILNKKYEKRLQKSKKVMWEKVKSNHQIKLWKKIWIYSSFFGGKRYYWIVKHLRNKD